MASKYDIEAISRDYRAGILSIREVGRQHGIDHSYLLRIAKKHGWKRDLSRRIKEEVTRKLVTGDVPTPNATDDEIVDTESKKVVSVLKLHRKDIVALRDLEIQLIAELKNNPKKLWVGQYQGEIITKELGLTASERSQAANNLANVQHKRIQLERQAYNLGDKAGGGDGEDITEIPIVFIAAPERKEESDE